MRHTISVLVENKFGVLARVAGMFSGRGFNIDTLNVAPTEDARFSRITATVRGDNQQLDQCIKQLNKLIEVIDVRDLRQGEYVARELILVKVKATSSTRPEIVQICDLFRARVVDVSPESLIVEVTADTSKREAFLEMIRPFGVIELTRTGRMAMPRGD